MTDKIKLDIPKENQFSALFSLMVETLASIQVLNDEVDLFRADDTSNNIEDVQSKTNFLSEKRKEMIEKAKLDILSKLTSEFG